MAVSLSIAQSTDRSTAIDTSAAPSKRAADTLAISSPLPGTKASDHSKSPWVAVGLSAGLPGLGQIYNRSYWKPPLIWGLGGYWIYEWIHLNDNYKDFRSRYSNSITPGNPTGDPLLLKIRDFYRDERDKFAWYLGALYLLNLVDAYVGASLYDFDVSPELTGNGRIVPRVRASIHLSF
jgi:hypothetical protein